MNANDLSLVRAWRNHEDVRKHMHTNHEISLTEHLNWFARMSKLEYVCLLIFELDDIPVGFAKLEIEDAGSSCIWGFYTAPEVEKGTGGKLGYAVLSHAFVELGLDSVNAEIIPENKNSLAFHQKLGFKPSGSSKANLADGNTDTNIICMALTRGDWTNKNRNELQ